MGVVVLRSNCPTDEGSCPIGVIVLRGRCPEGLSFGVVVLRGLLSYRIVAPRVVVPGVPVQGVVVLEPSMTDTFCHLYFLSFLHIPSLPVTFFIFQSL